MFEPVGAAAAFLPVRDLGGREFDGSVLLGTVGSQPEAVVEHRFAVNNAVPLTRTAVAATSFEMSLFIIFLMATAGFPTPH